MDRQQLYRRSATPLQFDNYVDLVQITYNNVINNNRPSSWLSGTSGDGKQEYYKLWPNSCTLLILMCMVRVVHPYSTPPHNRGLFQQSAFLLPNISIHCINPVWGGGVRKGPLYNLGYAAHNMLLIATPFFN